MGRPRLAPGDFGQVKARRDGDKWKARVYVRDAAGERREITRWARTKTDAEQAVKAAIDERVAVVMSSEITADTFVSDLAARWLADIETSDKAANTKAAYRSAVRLYVVPALGKLRLRDLLVPRLDKAIRTRAERTGPGAAKQMRAALSGMLDEAVAVHGALPVNPLKSIRKIHRGVKEPPRALTVDEQIRVMDAPRTWQRAIDLDIPDLIDWMLGTCMRIGEACAVRDRALNGRQLLDLDAGVVEVNATVVRLSSVCRACQHQRAEHATTGDRGCGVCDCPRFERRPETGLVVQERTKSDAGWRVLALPVDMVEMVHRRRSEVRIGAPETIRVLDRHGKITEQRNPGMLLYSPAGRVRDPRNTNRALREVLDWIDRPDDPDEPPPFSWVTSHVFRKTGLTRLADAGLPPHVVADVAGHSDPSMTQDVYMGRQVVSAEAAKVLIKPQEVKISGEFMGSAGLPISPLNV